MSESISPRIESISDLGSGLQDQTAGKSRVKPAAAGKSPPPHVPPISQPEEEEKKHELDEMA